MSSIMSDEKWKRQNADRLFKEKEKKKWDIRIHSI